MIPNERFCDNLTFWQWEFLNAFDSGQYRFFILEWARRHRKTTAAINLLIRECCEKPNHVGIYLAPFLTQAREIVWDDPNMLFTYLPEQSEIAWKKNEQKLSIRFANNSLLRICGADKLDRRRGIDCDTLVPDEWSSMKEKIWTEIFMPIMAGKGKVRRTVFLYTPKGINHATSMFDWAACLKEQGQILPRGGAAKKTKTGWFVSRVINDVTNFLDAEFLQMAEERWPKAIRDQELNCARITDEQMVLITSAMIDELKHHHIYPTKTKQIISCDPSLGGDACPIMFIKNGRLEEKKILHERNPMIICGEVIAMGYRNDCKDFIIDTTGISIGKAIAERMIEQGHTQVQFFETAGKPMEEFRFKNKKAEAWWYVAEQITSHEVPYIEDFNIIEDITNVHYIVTDSRGKFQLEKKYETKKRLGHSPDDGDTFVMGIWGLQFVEYVQDQRDPRDGWKEEAKPLSYMAS